MAHGLPPANQLSQLCHFCMSPQMAGTKSCFVLLLKAMGLIPFKHDYAGCYIQIYDDYLYQGQAEVWALGG